MSVAAGINPTGETAVEICFLFFCFLFLFVSFLWFVFVPSLELGWLEFCFVLFLFVSFLGPRLVCSSLGECRFPGEWRRFPRELFEFVGGGCLDL